MEPFVPPGPPLKMVPGHWRLKRSHRHLYQSAADAPAEAKCWVRPHWAIKP